MLAFGTWSCAVIVGLSSLLGGCVAEELAPVETEPIVESLVPSQVAPEDDNELKPADTPEFLLGTFDIMGVEPSEGLITGGQEVIVTGSGFVPGMIVLFDQSPALDLFLIHEGMAVMRTPPHPAGRVDMWLYHLDIDWGIPRILEGPFLYYADVIVAEVNPDRGDIHGGDEVEVVGVGFDETTRFFVDGHLAIDQSVVDENTLTGFTPPGTPGLADVHVVNLSGTFSLEDGFRYGEAPTLQAIQPLWAPPEGGTKVRFEGSGLTPETSVFFDDEEAILLDVAKDQSSLEVLAPAGPAGQLASLSVVNSWGMATAEDVFQWSDEDADPYLLSCPSLFPTEGPTAGGLEITLLCSGLQYGADVQIGGVDAEVIELHAETQLLRVKTPPNAAGPADVVVENAYGSVTCLSTFTYVAPPAFWVESVAPSSGAIDGGDSILILGAGFEGSPSVLIGALPATDVEVLSATQISAVTPPGTPGHADVRVVQSGETVTLKHGFEYAGEELTLHLITPTMVARAGGTYLRVTGTAFTPDAKIFIDEVQTTPVAFVSSSELHVRSPKLEVGTYDATVEAEGGSATLESAVTIFDPQSGYSGTWGGDIDETLNVTVRGTNKYGPIAGAFVLVERAGDEPRYGYTDEYGQITFSEPGLYGPVSATATHPEFDAYSVLDFDAMNITIYLRPKNLGPGTPITPWPPATLSGQVDGLGKFVVPPPGSCSGMEIEETEHCKSCDAENPCEVDGFACLDVGVEGTFCLQTCLDPGDCPKGYVCGPAMGGTRCMAAPGEKIAKCLVSNPSPFYIEPEVPETGWVKPGETYELSSGRLGDVAVVCFGGYLTEDGDFTPTVMGVRRHIFAEPSATMTGLDVSLDIPLKKTLRLKLIDPPKWPGGMEDPAITISLDLGSDGAIAMTRTLIPAGDDVWLAPRQVAKLQGDVYDASYFFYTRLYSKTATKQPASYSLIAGIRQASETRLPVFENGEWKLDLSPIEDDLHGIWGPSSNQLYVVGDKGTILLFSGNAWTAQSSGTEQDLRAIDGRDATDIWAVGEKGTVLHFSGGGWGKVPAPADDYSDVVTAPGHPVYVVGNVRIRRFEQDAWSVEGPPWVQGVQAIDLHEDGSMVAVGGAGRLYRRVPAGDWTLLDTPTEADLYDVIHLGDEIIAVGAGGTIISHVSGGPVKVVDVSTDRDLHALTVDYEGQVIVVGDDGVVLHRLNGVWAEDTIIDYRSAAYDIFAPPDLGPVRVVGSSAFIIGPLLHFPYVTAPVHDGNLDTPKMAWTWNGGPENQVTRLRVYADTGKLLWTFVVNGDETEFTMPDIQLLMGYEPLPSGKKRLEISRILNTNFDIDNYTSREWSIYRRDAWSTNRSYFLIE